MQLSLFLFVLLLFSVFIVLPFSRGGIKIAIIKEKRNNTRSDVDLYLDNTTLKKQTTI
jgi:hypothetical protein